jgi:hypothetical protein
MRMVKGKFWISKKIWIDEKTEILFTHYKWLNGLDIYSIGLKLKTCYNWLS